MTDLASGPLETKRERNAMEARARARYYELGQAAAQRAEPVDACPFRRPDRVNAWVRGWHAGEDERLRLEVWVAERRGMPHVLGGGVGV